MKNFLKNSFAVVLLLLTGSACSTTFLHQPAPAPQKPVAEDPYEKEALVAARNYWTKMSKFQKGVSFGDMKAIRVNEVTYKVEGMVDKSTRVGVYNIKSKVFSEKGTIDSKYDDDDGYYGDKK